MKIRRKANHFAFRRSSCFQSDDHPTTLQLSSIFTARRFVNGIQRNFICNYLLIFDGKCNRHIINMYTSIRDKILFLFINLKTFHLLKALSLRVCSALGRDSIKSHLQLRKANRVTRVRIALQQMFERNPQIMINQNLACNGGFFQ